jgi:hypothetical protein
MKTENKINTEPANSRNTMLVVCAAMHESKHSCTGFGGVSASAGFGKCAIWLEKFFVNR